MKTHIIVPYWFGYRCYHVEVTGDGDGTEYARQHIREADLKWREHWCQIHLPPKPEWL